MKEKEYEMEDGEMEMEEGSKDKSWQAECDANDLMRAAEIKGDKARYDAALVLLQKKKAAIESIADLKAARNKSFMKGKEA